MPRCCTPFVSVAGLVESNTSYILLEDISEKHIFADVPGKLSKWVLQSSDLRDSEIVDSYPRWKYLKPHTTMITMRQNLTLHSEIVLCI